MLSNYYVNNTQYEAKSKFVNDLNYLFSTTIDKASSTGISEITKQELNYIDVFFNSCPKEFYDEILLQVIDNFVSRLIYRYSNPYQGFQMVNDFFVKFITQDRFLTILPRIPQNIDITNTFQLISACLLGDYHDLSSFYLTHFVSKENRKISYLAHLIPVFLSQKRYTAIDYLLNNLSGWEEPEILKSFIKSGNYDSVLLKKVTSKSGKIVDDELINIISNLNWTLDVKKEAFDNCILSHHFSDSTLNFYLSYVKKSPEFLDAEKLILNQNGNTFLSNLNNKNYLKEWIKINPYVFVYHLDFLLNEKLIDPSLAKDMLINHVSKSSYATTSHFSQDLIDNYFKCLNISWNSEEGQTFILNCYEQNNFIGSQLFLTKTETIHDFNPYLELNTTINEIVYKNMNDYFMQKENLLCLFYQLKHEQNSSKKDNLVDKIMSWANLGNHSIKDHDFINTSLFISFYKHIYAKETSSEEFFNKWLIQYKPKNDTFSPILKTFITTKFSNEVSELVIDLRQSNPFFEILSQYNEGNFINSIDSSNFYTISSIFQHKIAYIKNENNLSLINYIKQFKFGNHLDETLIKRSENNKKSGFFKFFTEEKKPLQLSLKGGQVTFIYDTKDLIQTNVESNDTTSETNYTLNNFEEIILIAKKDSTELNKVFNKYNDKNLNLEVKIRADKLIRQNIIFLENIQSSIETIDFDDIFFLKNNLGKYLIQCIDTYGKSITRYESLLAAEGSKLLYKKSIDTLDDYKEKIDNEALKQLTLLEKELDLVKEHIISQFNGDLLSDMRVNTRILKGRMQHNPLINTDKEMTIEDGGDNHIGAKVVTLNSPKL